jgi:class 3 adenylate cyclase/tetratricopeptide (TPR) repeat protein
VTEPRKERKVVTVIFADLVGFTERAETLDPEDVEEILRPYHERLRTELERFGGTVEKFIGDAVMAVFGAPIAREDDPERAVRAALAIRDWAIESGDVEVRVAINTGETIVSLDARPEAGEAMVAGDVVNTASRMQAAAPTNGILVGEQTHRATQHVIEYRTADGVAAKGKRAPVPVWEALQARSRFGVDVRQHGGAPLVGRVRELDVLASALERVKQERSVQLVTLVGVPGIGKSRLVWELFKAIERGEELVFWRQGRSLPYGDGVSFWSLSEMVKAHAGILESDAPEAVGEKLTAAVTDAVGEADSEWVLSHLRPLAGVASESELGGNRRDEAFAAWRRFFEALAERRPLVQVFEDLHFADDGLLDFIDHVAEWSTDVPLLVVCTARPELLDRRPGWGGGKLNATTLALSPLSDEDAARLVGELLERRLLPAETQAALLERAGGNPLYAEQFARLYLERGSVDELPLPETVQGLIDARLDALPQEEKELLQDAAVVGKVFWTGALGRGTDVVQTLLHALERKEFVRRERRPSVEGEAEFVFRHLLVRDVAYGQIPRAARADKHRLVAAWIESLGRPEDHAELVAHHYLAALELARAARRDIDGLAASARAAVQAAGDRSLALNAFGAALRYYEQALELTPSDATDRPELLLQRARAALYSGRANRDALLREAVDALLVARNAALAAEGEVLLADSAWYAGERNRVSEHLDRGLELVADASPSFSKAFVLAQAARFDMLAARYPRMLEHGRRALAIADELGFDEVRAHVLISLGAGRVRSGDVEGIADVETGVEIARRIGSAELVRGLTNFGVAAGDLGEFIRAFALHEEALAMAERMGQQGMRRFVHGSRAGYLFQLGRWDEALEAANEFITEAAVDPHYLEAANLGMRALIAFARGDAASALADTERGLELARSARDPQSLFPSIARRATILLEAGESDNARDVVEELFTHVDSGERLAYAPQPQWVVALAALGGVERVLGLLRQMPPSPWKDASIATAEGDYATAAEIFGSRGAVESEAFLRLREAEQLIEAGRRSEADVHLQKALAFYRTVGATRYIREAEALLRESA